MGKESLPFPRELKKKLFPSPHVGREIEKNLFPSHGKCAIFPFFIGEKSFFFHVGSEIEKNFSPSPMWEGKEGGIPPLFPPPNGHPDIKEQFTNEQIYRIKEIEEQSHILNKKIVVEI